jgi:hypothetical protein
MEPIGAARIDGVSVPIGIGGQLQLKVAEVFWPKRADQLEAGL